MTTSHHPLDNKLLLGRYRIMRLLGEGGMGAVHLARVEGAEGFTRPVVVKRMRRDMRASEEGNRLFIREAKILSKLQHPNIVGISDFGVEDGAHIMVLEYVHGYNLTPWLDYRHHRGSPLPVDICLYIVRRVLDALHYAHHFSTEEGREIEIVHRDISPDNVLLSNNGFVHLLDFGIASMRGPDGGGTTKSAGFRGKLCYAAPETVKGEQATPSSDQYSAAVVLLELLTGKTSFESESIARTFDLMVHHVPAPPSTTRDDIPDGLDDVLARALAKDPKERFSSVYAFARELKRFQQLDDDEVAEQLKETVRREFDSLPGEVGVESLKERELSLEKALSLIPAAPTRAAHSLPTVLDTSPAPRTRAETPSAISATSPVPAPAQGHLHGLLWGLLVVGGLIAVGLGAAVALLSRASGDGQVVVVGGDMSNAGATSAPPRVNQEPTPAAALVSSSPQGLEVAPPSTPPRAGPSDGAGSRSTAPDRQRALARAVQQKSSAFQSCFAKHLDQAQQSPETVLHFTVAANDAPPQVVVEPSSLAATPLGSCLKGAAALVQFPKLSEPVAFRVPVKARISRSKGNP